MVAILWRFDSYLGHPSREPYFAAICDQAFPVSSSRKSVGQISWSTALSSGQTNIRDPLIESYSRTRITRSRKS